MFSCSYTDFQRLFYLFCHWQKEQNKALIHRHMNEGFYFQISIDPLFPTGYFPSHLDWYSVVFRHLSILRSRNRPAKVRLLHKLHSPFGCLSYIRELYFQWVMRHCSAEDVIQPALSNRMLLGLWYHLVPIRYVYAADTHQYAHRLVQHPAGIVRYFVLFAGASNIRVLSCMNLTFLLPRSAWLS